MLQYNQKSLILDTIADKKLNAVVDKAVDTNKERGIIADTKLNAVTDKAVDADKVQDTIASK